MSIELQKQIMPGPHEPAQRKNSMWLAFALSLFTPGLGQFYNGQPLRCIVFYLMNFVILLLCGFSGMLSVFAGTAAFLALAITWRLYTIADAMLGARKEVPEARIIPKWYALAAGGVGMLLISIFMPTRGLINYQTFSIPSTANEPNLYLGEFVMADMDYYEDHKIGYGDQIVYEGADGLPYTYRVAGLPGDHFRLQDDVPVIDGVKNVTEYLRDTVQQTGPAEIHRETYPDGKVHEIIMSKTKFEGAIVNTDEQLIPEGYVYVLGDSRDNAMDSRYTGIIPVQRIMGKCLYVYWSNRIKRIGTRLYEES